MLETIGHIIVGQFASKFEIKVRTRSQGVQAEDQTAYAQDYGEDAFEQVGDVTRSTFGWIFGKCLHLRVVAKNNIARLVKNIN